MKSISLYPHTFKADVVVTSDLTVQGTTVGVGGDGGGGGSPGSSYDLAVANTVFASVVDAGILKGDGGLLTNVASTGLDLQDGTLEVNGNVRASYFLGDGALVNSVVTGTAVVSGQLSAANVTASALTASRVLVTEAGGRLGTSTVTATELGHVGGVTSGIQSQLSGKQPTVTGAATSITSANLATNRVLASNASGKVAATNHGISGNNVGINTTTPLQALDVVGNVAVSGAMVAGGAVVGSSLVGDGALVANVGVSNITGLPDYIEHRLSAFESEYRVFVSPRGSDTANTGTSPDAPFASIKHACAVAAGRVSPTVGITIFVETGTYTEDNPIVVPRNTAIIGDNLRRVLVLPQHPHRDFFHVHNAVYLWGLRFIDLQRPAFCVAFPCAMADCSIQNGQVTSPVVLYSPAGYTEPPTVHIEPPNEPAGTMAEAVAVVEDGVITALTITNAGSGYTERPHISIHAPTSQRPFITTSPYVQNCSSITGPFDRTGVKITELPPYNESNVGGTGREVDVEGAGGGIRIDGVVCAPQSPLRSFVGDAFTQVNQGGPGHLIINLGYAQFVSCFTTFCTYSYKCASGSFCNISNSVTDFGLYGLVAKGYWPTPFGQGTIVASQASAVASVQLGEQGSGYTEAPTVTISDPDLAGGTTATAVAQIDGGKVTGIVLTDPGSGYTAAPSVTFSSGDGGQGATATAVLTGISEFGLVTSGSRKPDIGSLALVNGDWHVVTGATIIQTNEYEITVFPAPAFVTQGASVAFHALSSVSTGSHVMEFVGSGVTYNALPEYGGVPDSGSEIIEYSPGRCYYTTSDHLGNTKVGKLFAIEQATGTVTISTDRFNLSGLNSIGPFRRNGVAVGVQLQEVSNNPDLLSSTGQADSTTVPTQRAVKTYVDARVLPQAGFTRQSLVKLSDNDFDTVWSTLTNVDVGLANVTDVEQIPLAEKASANGVATLDASSRLSVSQFPTAVTADVQFANLALTGTITASALTASRVLVTESEGRLGTSAVTATELGYLSGTLMNVQSQLDGKQNIITGGASSITSANLTAGRVLASDTNGKVVVTNHGISGSNVGINKTSPTKELDVVGDVGVSGNVVANSVTASALTASRVLVSESEGRLGTSEVTATELGYVGGVTSGLQTQLNNKEPTVTGGASSITSANLTAHRVLASDTNGKVAVTNHGILGSNVGINTANPTKELDVVGDVAVSGNVVANSVTASALTASRVLVTESEGRLGTSAVTATELGYVGGVTSGLQTQLNNKEPTVTGGASSITSANLTAHRVLASDTNGKVAVTNHGILGSNVGINTASPTKELDVVGDVGVSGMVSMTTSALLGNSGIQYSNATYAGPLVEKRTSGSGRWGVMSEGTDARVYTTGTGSTGRLMMGFALAETIYLDAVTVLQGGTLSSNAGLVGINTALPEYALHVVGDARVEGEMYATGDITAFSDARLKTNLVPLNFAMPKVRELTGYTFERVDLTSERRYAGLVAQDVGRVFPEAVHAVANTLSISHGSLSALWTEALKELDDRVSRIEAALGF
jgi:hypothetical protein